MTTKIEDRRSRRRVTVLVENAIAAAPRSLPSPTTGDELVLVLVRDLDLWLVKARHRRHGVLPRACRRLDLERLP